MHDDCEDEGRRASARKMAMVGFAAYGFALGVLLALGKTR